MKKIKLGFSVLALVGLTYLTSCVKDDPKIIPPPVVTAYHGDLEVYVKQDTEMGPDVEGAEVNLYLTQVSALDEKVWIKGMVTSNANGHKSAYFKGIETKANTSLQRKVVVEAKNNGQQFSIEVGVYGNSTGNRLNSVTLVLK